MLERMELERTHKKQTYGECIVCYLRERRLRVDSVHPEGCPKVYIRRLFCCVMTPMSALRNISLKPLSIPYAFARIFRNSLASPARKMSTDCKFVQVCHIFIVSFFSRLTHLNHPGRPHISESNRLRINVRHSSLRLFSKASGVCHLLSLPT